MPSKISRSAGRNRAVALLAAAFLLLGVQASGSAIGPRETMQATIDEVLAVLNDPALDKAGRRSALEQIAYANFDMVTMSRLVLARNYKKFSPEQRDQYVVEFKEYLANNYGGRIERYEQERVEITGLREEPRGDVTVQTKILGGEFENAIVDYRLRKKDGRWRIIDVVIEGISMVSNFRDQFKEVLARGGPEHLLAKLREKNALGPLEN
jgi:phospholipid transport system substrate-binding protein